MRSTSGILEALVHNKYETLRCDVFTHEWNNLQEYCKLYLLICMQPICCLEIISNSQTYLPLATICLLSTANSFWMTNRMHKKYESEFVFFLKVVSFIRRFNIEFDIFGWHMKAGCFCSWHWGIYDGSIKYLSVVSHIFSHEYSWRSSPDLWNGMVLQNVILSYNP